MKLEEFRAMDLDRRCDAIWEWGFYVSRQKTNTINAVLYSINGFFAEMILRLEDNAIIDVVAIETVTKTEDIGYFIKKDNPFAKYL